MSYFCDGLGGVHCGGFCGGFCVVQIKPRIQDAKEFIFVHDPFLASVTTKLAASLIQLPHT